jgi:hypothetical protein
MTITPHDQPHIPPLQIDLDEILSTLALELSRVRICDQCQQSVPSLINDLAHLGDYSFIAFRISSLPKFRRWARRKVIHNSTGKDEHFLRMAGNSGHGNGPSF